MIVTISEEVSPEGGLGSGSSSAVERDNVLVSHHVRQRKAGSWEVAAVSWLLCLPTWSVQERHYCPSPYPPTI